MELYAILVFWHPFAFFETGVELRVQNGLSKNFENGDWLFMNTVEWEAIPKTIINICCCIGFSIYTVTFFMATSYFSKYLPKNVAPNQKAAEIKKMGIFVCAKTSASNTSSEPCPDQKIKPYG